MRNSYVTQTVDTQIDEEGKAAIGKGGEVVVPPSARLVHRGSNDMDKELMVTGEYIWSYSEKLPKKHVTELGFQTSSNIKPRSSFTFDFVSNNYGGDAGTYTDEARDILSQSRNSSRQGHNNGSRFKRLTSMSVYNRPEPISSNSRLRKCFSSPGARSSTRTWESTSKCTGPDR